MVRFLNQECFKKIITNTSVVYSPTYYAILWHWNPLSFTRLFIHRKSQYFHLFLSYTESNEFFPLIHFLISLYISEYSTVEMETNYLFNKSITRFGIIVSHASYCTRPITLVATFTLTTFVKASSHKPHYLQMFHHFSFFCGLYCFPFVPLLPLALNHTSARERTYVMRR